MKGKNMDIYIDVIFAENVLMNYIILYVTGIVLKYKTKNKKILLASMIGSLYACMMYLNINILKNAFLKIILSIIIIQIAFECKTAKEMLKVMIIFYFISFSFGGATFFFLYGVKPEKIKIVNGRFNGIYPLKILIMTGTFASVLIIMALQIMKKVKIKNELYCKVLLEEKEEMDAFIDSGNMLKDPITNYPVIVVQEDELKKYYSKEFLEYIEKIMKGGKLEYNEKLKKEISKIRIIPFSSIGKENGIMVGIKKEKIHIYYEEEKYEIKDVIIGVYQGNLFKNKKYKAILGIDVIERGKRKNESISYH